MLAANQPVCETEQVNWRRCAKKLISRSLRAKASVLVPYSCDLPDAFYSLGIHSQLIRCGYDRSGPCALVFGPGKISLHPWRVVMADAGPGFEERAARFDAELAAREAAATEAVRQVALRESARRAQLVALAAGFEAWIANEPCPGSRWQIAAASVLVQITAWRAGHASDTDFHTALRGFRATLRAADVQDGIVQRFQVR